METIFGWQTFYHQNKPAKLEKILEQRVGTPTQQKWITKLLGYSFLVEYKKGKENKATDTLSRRLESLDDLSDDLFVVEN